MVPPEPAVAEMVSEFESDRKFNIGDIVIYDSAIVTVTPQVTR